MKLSRRKAVEITYRLWGWLYENPSKKKQEWPEWKRNGGKVQDMYVFLDCACCAYANQFKDVDCKRCPVPVLRDNECGVDKSPYTRWEEAKTNKTRKKYAKIIRDSAKDELK